LLAVLENIEFEPKNPKVFAFTFTEKRLFTEKTSRKFIFIGFESLITAWLDVVAL
jgi:hypothetical protein